MNLKFVKKVLLVMMSVFMLIAAVPVSAMAMDESSNEKLYEYFNYVDSLRMPRTLIVGEGRAKSKEAYEDDSLYFFVDCDPKVKPDYCCDVENMFDLWLLRECQWDIVVLENLPMEIYLNGFGINNAYRLLKRGGCITFILSEGFLNYCKQMMKLKKVIAIDPVRFDEVIKLFRDCAKRAIYMAKNDYEAYFNIDLFDKPESKKSFMEKFFDFDTESYDSTEYDVKLIPAAQSWGTELFPRITTRTVDDDVEFIVQINKL